MKNQLFRGAQGTVFVKEMIKNSPLEGVLFEDRFRAPIWTTFRSKMAPKWAPNRTPRGARDGPESSPEFRPENGSKKYPKMDPKRGPKWGPKRSKMAPWRGGRPATGPPSPLGSPQWTEMGPETARDRPRGPLEAKELLEFRLFWLKEALGWGADQRSSLIQEDDFISDRLEAIDTVFDDDRGHLELL